MTTRGIVAMLVTVLCAVVAIIALTLTGHEELLGNVVQLFAGVALVVFVAALGCSGSR